MSVSVVWHGSQLLLACLGKEGRKKESAAEKPSRAESEHQLKAVQEHGEPVCTDESGSIDASEGNPQPLRFLSAHDDRRPGAFPVGMSDEDDEAMSDASALDGDDEDPITAELVDVNAEEQIIREKVGITLRKERAKAPVAQVVPKRCCDYRRTVIAVIVLALVIILGIVLGLTLPKDDGRPPAPIPSKEAIIATISAVSSDGGEALQTNGSAQHDALEWLANDTFQGYHTDEKLIQRYTLATLSTAPMAAAGSITPCGSTVVMSVIAGGNLSVGSRATQPLEPLRVSALAVTI